VGHEVAGRSFLKKLCIQLEDMGEDLVSYPLFKEPGKTNDHITPGKTQEDNQDGDKYNYAGQAKEVGGSYGQGFQGVNTLFDESRDNELKKVDYDQCGKPTKNPQAMAPEGGEEEVAKL